MVVEEIPEHARQYGMDVIARLKVAHKYPAGAGSWAAAKTPVTTMPATGPPTCPRSPAACVMPRTATLDVRLKEMQVRPAQCLLPTSLLSSIQSAVWTDRRALRCSQTTIGPALTKRIHTVTKPPKESAITHDAAGAIKDMESFINNLSRQAKAKKG